MQRNRRHAERLDIPLKACSDLVTVVVEGAPLDSDAIAAAGRAGWQEADAGLWERGAIYARLLHIEDGSGCYYAMVSHG